MDCEALRAAMKGLGTNEDAIVNVLGYRSSVQRQDVCTMYKTMFGKVRLVLGGNLGAMTLRLDHRSASACVKNYGRPKTLDKAVVAPSSLRLILASSGSCVLGVRLLRRARTCWCVAVFVPQFAPTFLRSFSQNLREELKGETSGNFKELLAALCLGAVEYDVYEVNRAIKVRPT